MRDFKKYTNKQITNAIKFNPQAARLYFEERGG
jgi:hypothetical protein